MSTIGGLVGGPVGAVVGDLGGAIGTGASRLFRAHFAPPKSRWPFLFTNVQKRRKSNRKISPIMKALQRFLDCVPCYATKKSLN
jgi:hypothetical protein